MAAPAFPVKAGRLSATSAPILSRATLPSHERSASRARALVAAALGESDPLTSTACLLVSELVTNAILHSRSCRTGGTVAVTIRDTRPGVRVEVTDDGSADSVPVLKGDPADTGGRGLVLVNTLARAWGYRRLATSTTVWFQLGP